jgi:hypothetical protein
MSRVKYKALSDPPSQEPLEGGSDSALPFTSNTVAALTGFIVWLTDTKLPTLPQIVRLQQPVAPQNLIRTNWLVISKAWR